MEIAITWPRASIDSCLRTLERNDYFADKASSSYIVEKSRWIVRARPGSLSLLRIPPASPVTLSGLSGCLVKPHHSTLAKRDWGKNTRQFLRHSLSRLPMPPDPENTDSDSAHATRGRQRPGAACDECRRRKLRCDGQQPQCSICRDTNVVCEVTQRSVRGPKKGHLKALKNRVAYLEAMLDSHQQTEPLGSFRNSNGVTVGTNSTSPVDQTLGHAPDPWPPTRNTASSGSDHQHEAFLLNRFGPQSNGSTLPSDFGNQQWSPSPALPASNLPPSEILQAELYRLNP